MSQETAGARLVITGAAITSTMERSMINTTVQSRRGFLAVLGAGAAAVATPAALAATAPSAETAASGLAPSVAAPSLDAALLQLVDNYFAAQAEYSRLGAIIDAATEKRDAANPIPDALLIRRDDIELGIPEMTAHRVGRSAYDWCCSRDIDRLRKPKWPVIETIEPPEGVEFRFYGGSDVVRYVEPSAAARARGDEILKAFDEWHPRHQREPRGVRTAERKQDAAFMRSERLLLKINRSRASTIEGLVAKAEAAAHDGHSDPTIAEETHVSIVRDLLAMGHVGRARS